MDQARTRQISEEAVALLGSGSQVVPFSQRYDGFDLEEAYDVVAKVLELRRARGEIPIGRKIGFTNRAIWDTLGISAPVWNFVFARTVSDVMAPDTTFALSSLPEPRIEPELVVHFATTPVLGMSEADLLSCVDWVAAGFEIVYSIFPAWKFSAADATAAYGVHGALLVGTKHYLAGNKTERMRALSDFSVELKNDRGEVRKGYARDILGGPLLALTFLIEEIARYPVSEPLRAGELVTTGTLTEAMPAVPGETWTAHFTGIDLKPLSLRFC